MSSCGRVKLRQMGVVVRAKIQTVEEIYRLIRNAVTGRTPVSALYDSLPRLLCPHRLGRNRSGQVRVLCYQYGGDSSSRLEPIGSPANWRCMKLEKFSRVQLLDDLGAPPRTILARRPASPMSMWTPRIIRTAFHTADSEADR